MTGKARIAVIPYGISPSEAGYSRGAGGFGRPRGGRRGEVLFGFVGRFVEQKGVDVLLRSFAKLRGQDHPVVLALAGSGPLEGSLRRLASNLGIGDRVRFLGFLLDPHPLLRTLDVLVLPSRWEGFGRVLLEAMLWRKSVIASKVSSIPEIVNHGNTGLLTDPDSVSSLHHAMATLARSPALRNRLGQNGYARVRRDFSLAHMVDSTLRLYEAVLAP